MQRSFYLFLISAVFLAFCAGMAATYFKWYPWRVVYQTMKEAGIFAEGHQGERPTTMFQKFVHDIGGKPYRLLIEDVERMKIPKGSKKFNLDQAGMLMSGFSNDAPEGYILVSASFDFKGRYNDGYVLFSTDGKYIRHWVNGGKMMSDIDYGRRKILAERTERSWCSNNRNPGRTVLPVLHHSIETAPDGTYWTNIGDTIQQFNPDKLHRGQHPVMRKISFEKIIKHNREINPLMMRINSKMIYSYNPFRASLMPIVPDESYHHNDAEPFVDTHYRTKLGYALLVSVRNQNLIMVLDPATAKILWYAQGITEWQHDVEYHKGYVYAYDNGPFRGYARVVRISLDPAKNPHKNFDVVLDGRKIGWSQNFRGDLQVIEDGGHMYYLISMIDKAQVMLYRDDYKPVFGVQNFFKGHQTFGLQVHGAEFMTPKQYAELEAGCKRADD